jgi:hypothetical protein
MSRSKELFIEATGGFRLGESKAEFMKRCRSIEKLERKVRSGVFTDDELKQLRDLKGLPDDEWGDLHE